ncbi:hypothetical protein HFN00_36280 [Rhizobium leguminosarum]|nr:hypothetical protein [Rhizobium leguminosarum]MBY5435136.1 hypothetical protein [Rhizobium leguminosarum]NEK46893.1 hypothetical protein [Rhizobium leguminosarum]
MPYRSGQPSKTDKLLVGTQGWRIASIEPDQRTRGMVLNDSVDTVEDWHRHGFGTSVLLSR